MNPKTDELKKKASYIRNQILDMCVNAKTGHVTSSFSCVETLVSLYYGGILRFNASDPKWEGRDRFVLSKGQASPILYTILADLGFFSKNELNKFCAADGIFGVHLQNDVPGVEISSGSLGHGFGIAAGIAMGAKIDRKPYLTFALLGDGECYEGSIWESAMFAGHHKLNNLVAIVDRNWLCATAFTEKIVKLDPMDKKWEAFGWKAVKINGHSFNEIFSALKDIRKRKASKPLVIIADTVKGKGVPFMENKVRWHSLAPQGKDAEMAKKILCARGER